MGSLLFVTKIVTRICLEILKIFDILDILDSLDILGSLDILESDPHPIVEDLPCEDNLQLDQDLRLKKILAKYRTRHVSCSHYLLILTLKILLVNS